VYKTSSSWISSVLIQYLILQRRTANPNPMENISSLGMNYADYISHQKRMANHNPMEGIPTINVRGAPPIAYFNVNSTKAEELSLQMTFPPEKVSAKEQLRYIHQQFLELKDGTNSEGSDTVFDSRNTECKPQLPPLPSGKQYSIIYKTLLQRNLPFGHMAFGPHAYLSGPPIRSIAYIGTTDVSEKTGGPAVPKEPDDVRKFESRLQKLENQWEKSAAAKQIAEFLKAHAKQKTDDIGLDEEFPEFVDIRGKSMNTVTKVVGIGLGNPGEHLLPGGVETLDRSWFQFRTLIHIAQELKKIQGKGIIKIFVQDAVYRPLTEFVAKHLSEEHECEVQIVEDPLGYQEMDEQTVLFHGQQFPNYNVADIALEVAGEDGLAGFLGPEIDVEMDHQKVLTNKRLGDTTMHNLGQLNSSKTYDWAKSCKTALIKSKENWYTVDPHFYAKLR